MGLALLVTNSLIKFPARGSFIKIRSLFRGDWERAEHWIEVHEQIVEILTNCVRDLDCGSFQTGNGCLDLPMLSL